MQSQTRAEVATWDRTANFMLTKLGTDLHNHWILADPWRRKAESMVKVWKVLLHYGRPLRPAREKRCAHDWPRAVGEQVMALCQRVDQQRNRTGWRRWASARATQARQWPGKFLSTARHDAVAIGRGRTAA